ncbi:inorganic phosphate transporter [Nonomuraea sp. MG754425]|uniref:inorganic phosphate transporter n=1 Tax=Nonomuraea sp. MG754425 TaxID=2570319 RepID=UPI001F3D4F58|nr:inorganic phosphate transporter [Nonomuraea sp. MG754425]
MFALFTGFNDAGAVIGLGLRVRGLRPITALLLLGLAVVAAPLAVGTAVAATLSTRLVSFEGDQAPLLAGIAAAVLVTVVLATCRLPTSLTLALIGGVSGAGLGAGAAVDWSLVAAVLAAAAVAPFAGMLAARAVTWLVGILPARKGAGERLRRMHVAAFLATCVAYGANDGQKLLAVYAAVHAVTPGLAATSVGAQALLAGCFLAGAVLGLRRLAASIGGGLAAADTSAIVVTETSGAAVVLGTALLGAPVSMTQSLSGAMIGTGLARGTRRVRWRAVLHLGTAWLLTLPMALTCAAVAGAVVGGVAR